jgi:hypothetical protein
MDGLSLLRCARNAGLRVEAAGEKLLIRGPRRAEPMVKLLADHKAAVLAVLASTVDSALEPVRWFERTVPVAECEPGLEQPCAARRGRVQELDRAILHFCCQCGAYAPFGFGVRLRAGQSGQWYCFDHRPRPSRI